MKKKNIITKLKTLNSKLSAFSFLLSALLLSSCDEGDIVEKTFSAASSGKCVKMTARVGGVDAWPSGYSVALAGFTEDNRYALLQRAVPVAPAEGQEVEVVLPNLRSEVSTVELVVTNKLRERIMTLASIDMQKYAEGSDTIRMELGRVDASPFAVIQSGIFDKACIQCHGGNGRAAAGLDLTSGKSYDNLVGHASTKVEGALRVMPGEAGKSLMRNILNEGGENILHYNHTEVLSSLFKENLGEVKTLIDVWINSLEKAENAAESEN